MLKYSLEEAQASFNEILNLADRGQQVLIQRGNGKKYVLQKTELPKSSNTRK